VSWNLKAMCFSFVVAVVVFVNFISPFLSDHLLSIASSLQTETHNQRYDTTMKSRVKWRQQQQQKQPTKPERISFFSLWSHDLPNYFFYTHYCRMCVFSIFIIIIYMNEKKI
jgi:hypothetical protein